ncbi:hypothetical protein ABZP36_007836 [Zizania latifolia]
MTSQSDSPNRFFQIYMSRKRKFLDSVQHSESGSAVSHGSELVATANDSHLGEESCLKNPAGLSSVLNNSQGFSLKDIPSGTTKLSGIRCTTSPWQPNETMFCTISTDNGTVKCQDPSNLISPLMGVCANHTISSKPRHPHTTLGLMHCKTVSNNSLAKDKDSTDQSQTAVVQNLLLSCEKGGQSIVSMDHPSLSYHDKIQQKKRIQSYEAVKHDVQDFTKAVDISSSLSPHSLDDEIKSFGQLSPSVYESLWSGTIQLSSTAKVSVVAFFKSGEKNQDITWPKVIEIKGKVKLDAFEKFVHELRRCQTRSLMVISLCWKVGTSKAGLKGMKEVAENFEVSQKVGFADICDGYSLYVCPRSDAVITILAKCGFFKGMSAVDTNQDSLMGCIVWRRKGSPSTPCSNDPGVDSSRNIRKIQDDIEKTQEIQSTSVKTHAVATGLPSLASTQTLQPHQITPFKAPSLIACQQSQVPASHEVHKQLLTVPEIQQHVQPITDSHCGSFGVGHPVSHSQNHMADAFLGRRQQEYASNAAESSKHHKNHPFVLQPDSCGAHRPNDTEDLPEFDFTPLCGAEVKYNVHLLNRETTATSSMSTRPKLSGNKSSRPFQQPLQQSFLGEGINNHGNVEGNRNVTDMMSREITNQVSHCKTERESFRNKDGVDTEDMQEWRFQGIENGKPHQSSSTKLPSPSLKTCTRAEAPSQEFPPITQRSHSPLEVEGSSSAHQPIMQPGCFNVPGDQGSFPQHRPPALADQCFTARHPPVLAGQGSVLPSVLQDQVFVPRHRRPALADQGSVPSHPPVRADQGFVPWHPPPVAEHGLFLRHHPLLADQDLFPRRPPFPTDQGSFPLHPPPLPAGQWHPRPVSAPGHVRPPASSAYMRSTASSGPMRPSSSSAPPGTWRPVLHPWQVHHHYGPERSNGPSGSRNIPGHPSGFGNGSGGRPPHQAHQ